MNKIIILAAIGVALTGSRASALPAFDGDWRVAVRTETGPCGDGYVLPLRVQDSEVSYTGVFSVEASGSVGPAGQVSLTLSKGADMLKATGRIKGQTGSGTWAAAGEECSGVWEARRA